MANIFSHPQYVPSGNWSVVGYNLYKSTATSNGAPAPFGPWSPVTGYQGYTTTTDILDTAGGYWDLYRVEPIVSINGQQVTMPMSRAFKATDPLYDVQISSLLDHFRTNLIDDKPVYQMETTDPTEGTGAAIMPFITNSSTDTFFLSFMPNANPVKIQPDETIVWHGTNKAGATPLQQYTDFFASDTGGFIKFKTTPATGDYLKVEYKMTKYTNDELRNLLLNAVSGLSLYGINGYEVRQSNNLYYLVSPLANRDLGEIVCLIAKKNLLESKVQSSFESAEQWETQDIKFVADPSRSIQAATLFAADLDEMLRHRANGYIIGSRSANHGTGEFDSFFNTSGILPVYSMIVSNYNAFGWWL